MQILVVTLVSVLIAFFGCIAVQHAQLYYHFVQSSYTHAQDYCYAEAFLIENVAFLRQGAVVLRYDQPYSVTQGLFSFSLLILNETTCSVIIKKQECVVIDALYTRKSLGI